MKKKTKKILTIVAVVVLVLIISLALVIKLFADSAIKMAVETEGTKALNVNVSVGGVKLSLLKGDLGMNGLVIDNPPGYEHDKMLSVSNAYVKVDIGSLLSDTVRIEQIKIDGIDVVMEQKGLTTNIGTIIKQMPAKDEGQKESEPQKSESKSKSLVISELELTNINVKVKLLPIPGKADTLELKLPPIRMQNIGEKDKVNTGELVKKIMQAIAQAITEQGRDLLPGELLDPISNQLKNVTDISKGVLEEGGNIGKDVLDTGKDIGGALKGLFKKEEK